MKNKEVKKSIQKKLFDARVTPTRSNGKEIIKRISFSQIDTFLRCPYEYQKTFVNKQIKKKIRRWGPIVGLGFSLHRALRDFYKQPLVERSLQNLHNFLEKNWSYADFKKWKNEEISKWKLKGRKALEDFYKTQYFKRKKVRVEVIFRANVEGLLFVGKIDRIDKLEEGMYEVIDYKYGDYMKDDSKRKLQLIFYYLGCKYGLNIIPNKLTYIFLDENKAESYCLTEQEIVKGLEQIRFILEEISSCDQYPPRVNNLCATCWVKPECPAWKTSTVKGE